MVTQSGLAVYAGITQPCRFPGYARSKIFTAAVLYQAFHSLCQACVGKRYATECGGQELEPDVLSGSDIKG